MGANSPPPRAYGTSTSSPPASEKRKASPTEADLESAHGADHVSSKRRIKSCDTCRRLKRRCESKAGEACHRCHVLNLDCSFGPRMESAHSPDESGHHSRPCQLCFEYKERLRKVEASVAHTQSLLTEALLSPPQISSPVVTGSENHGKSRAEQSSTPEQRHVRGRPSRTSDATDQSAPMKLVWEMNRHILGSRADKLDSDMSEDIVTRGILSDELAGTFLAGFSHVTRRWLFLSSNDISIRTRSPLLFATCVLAGLQIDSRRHDSALHWALHNHVEQLTTRLMLRSPLPLEVIQAMLIRSMWNLIPDKNNQSIDSWTLSGLAVMHGISSINFHECLKIPSDGLVNPRSRESMRSWNLLCLCHLQFSVGTGRIPMIPPLYLEQCNEILTLPAYDPRDHLVLSGVKLYAIVCKLLNSELVQVHSVIWDEVEDCRIECGPSYNSDMYRPMRFAYSCSNLILARRSLKYIVERPIKSPNRNPEALDPKTFIRAAIKHSHLILELFLELSDVTVYIRPAYENLLSSYAMVTLSEFSLCLEDWQKTLRLMENTSLHFQLSGKAEPVSKWALDSLRRYVNEVRAAQRMTESSGSSSSTSQRESFPSRESTVTIEGAQYGRKLVSGAQQEEFPSLEEVFSNN